MYRAYTTDEKTNIYQKDEQIMNEEFKTVAKFSDPMSAEIAAGMLNANGVHAEVVGQTSSYPSINAAIDSVEVKGNADDYELAKKRVAADDKAE